MAGRILASICKWICGRPAAPEPAGRPRFSIHHNPDPNRYRIHCPTLLL